eukprot:c9279_g1_i2.p1 GENE.c9279_g1_i2~~c9279_g1_i2.p1  ORF type:complete len:257 (+),score=32.57 c9279_g1_i2:22-771(+)
MNPYEVLGVSHNADDEEINRAYKKLARQWHPDKNPDNKDMATRKFKQIGQAKAILSDKNKRAMFDQYGVAEDTPSPPSHHYHHHSYADPFAHPFFYQQRQARPQHRDENFGISHLGPFIPLFMLLLFSLAGSDSQLRPDFSLQNTSEYSIRRVTTRRGVPYYTAPVFEENFATPEALKEVEDRVESQLSASLRSRCDLERQHKRHLDGLAKPGQEYSNCDKQCRETHAAQYRTKSCDLFEKYFGTGATR